MEETTAAWRDKLASWWESYVRRFLGRDEETDYHVRLKVAHTARVRNIAQQLMQARELPAQELAVVDAAALLHDVGRFPQYWQYRTFRDLLSVDHADLGVETLTEEGVWQLVPQETAVVLKQAVLWHNKRALPPEAAGAAWLPAKVVRDADKLDIFDMLTTDKEYRMPPTDGIAQHGGISPELEATVVSGRLGRPAQVKTAADQQVFRISWVYDLNTVEAVRYVAHAGFLPLLLAALPEGEAKERIGQAVEACVERRLETKA